MKFLKQFVSENLIFFIVNRAAGCFKKVSFKTSKVINVGDFFSYPK